MVAKNKLFAALSVIASIITVIVFFTGDGYVGDFFKRNLPNKAQPLPTHANPIKKAPESQHGEAISRLHADPFNKVLAKSNNIIIEIASNKHVYIRTKKGPEHFFRLKSYGKIIDAKISPSGKRAVVLSHEDGDNLDVEDANGLYHQRFTVNTEDARTLAKNMVWLSDSKLSIYLGNNPINPQFMLDDRMLSGDGTYTISFDKYNRISNIKKVY